MPKYDLNSQRIQDCLIGAGGEGNNCLINATLHGIQAQIQQNFDHFAPGGGAPAAPYQLSAEQLRDLRDYFNVPAHIANPVVGPGAAGPAQAYNQVNMQNFLRDIRDKNIYTNPNIQQNLRVRINTVLLNALNPGINLTLNLNEARAIAAGLGIPLAQQGKDIQSIRTAVQNYINNDVNRNRSLTAIELHYLGKEHNLFYAEPLPYEVACIKHESEAKEIEKKELAEKRLRLQRMNDEFLAAKRRMQRPFAFRLLNKDNYHWETIASSKASADYVKCHTGRQPDKWTPESIKHRKKTQGMYDVFRSMAAGKGGFDIKSILDALPQNHPFSPILSFLGMMFNSITGSSNKVKLKDSGELAENFEDFLDTFLKEKFPKNSNQRTIKRNKYISAWNKANDQEKLGLLNKLSTKMSQVGLLAESEQLTEAALEELDFNQVYKERCAVAQANADAVDAIAPANGGLGSHPGGSTPFTRAKRDLNIRKRQLEQVKARIKRKEVEIPEKFKQLEALDQQLLALMQKQVPSHIPNPGGGGGLIANPRAAARTREIHAVRQKINRINNSNHGTPHSLAKLRHELETLKTLDLPQAKQNYLAALRVYEGVRTAEIANTGTAPSAAQVQAYGLPVDGQLAASQTLVRRLERVKEQSQDLHTLNQKLNIGIIETKCAQQIKKEAEEDALLLAVMSIPPGGRPAVAMPPVLPVAPLMVMGIAPTSYAYKRYMAEETVRAAQYRYDQNTSNANAEFLERAKKDLKDLEERKNRAILRRDSNLPMYKQYRNKVAQSQQPEQILMRKVEEVERELNRNRVATL